MGWIKDIVTDLIVTIVICISVLFQNEILTSIVFGYSMLMLIAKIVVYFGDEYLQLLNKVDTEAPEWISHLLYGINVIALLSFKWWYTGAAWVLIWIFSWITQRKIRS